MTTPITPDPESFFIVGIGASAGGVQALESGSPKYVRIGEIKSAIDKLLLEKIPLAGIARVVDVSETGLQNYVNHKYQKQPRSVNVQAKKRGF